MPMVRDVPNAIDKVQAPHEIAACAGSSLQNEAMMLRRQEGPSQNKSLSMPDSGFVAVTALNGFEPLRSSSARDVLLACSMKPIEENCPPFKPDYQRQTESARQWHRDAAQRSQESVNLGPAEKYEVKEGDSLSGIAERLITGSNGKADAKEVAKLVKKLVDANKDAYPHLVCNPDLIRVGMRLKVPPEGQNGMRDEAAQPPHDSRKPPSSTDKDAQAELRRQGQESNTDPSKQGRDSKDDRGAIGERRQGEGTDEFGRRQKPDLQEGSRPPEPDNLDLMRPRLRDLIGKPPSVLDRATPPRLACAVAVSDVVNSADPRIRKTNNTNQLEKDMIAAGYERVPLDHVQPGDVIIGKREGIHQGKRWEMAGHAAIYMGDGMVFNNNSNSERMQIDSINKFRQGMHNEQGKWNPNGYSDVVVYRKRSNTSTAAA
ncbi:MAG TPA: LysM peptidoglycan-binding domain-containing protein [Candidatus Obscuribacterales bacterium]